MLTDVTSRCGLAGQEVKVYSHQGNEEAKPKINCDGISLFFVVYFSFHLTSGLVWMDPKILVGFSVADAQV